MFLLISRGQNLLRERRICEKQNNNLLNLVLTLKRQCVEIALEFQRSSFIIEYEKKQFTQSIYFFSKTTIKVTIITNITIHNSGENNKPCISRDLRFLTLLTNSSGRSECRYLDVRVVPSHNLRM